jgi:Ca2+/Na+ antiporter
VALAVVLLLLGAAAIFAGASGASRGIAGLSSLRGAPPPFVGALLLGSNLGPAVLAAYLAARGDALASAPAALGSAAFLLCFGMAAIVSIGTGLGEPEPGTIVYPAAVLLVAGFAIRSDVVSRTAGALLLVAFVLAAWLMRGERAAEIGAERLRQEATRGLRMPAWALAAGGLVLTVGGAALLTEGGSRLAGAGHLAGGFVAAAVMGPLASAATVRALARAARTGEPGIAAAKVLSTASFSMGALGLAAVIGPAVLDPAATVTYLAVVAAFALDSVTLLWSSLADWRLAAASAAAGVGWLWLAAKV